ncbi:MAG: hypothetical protein ACIAXF_09725 [Phycisphaerales bacterium JB063]
MTTLDWGIVGAMLLALIVVAVYCQRQVKSVADFLVAGRSAGRYMLTIGTGMVWVSAINIVAMFELYHSAGLVAMWWGMLSTPFAIYLAISGFGIYRFRQTRAMTVAQFLEARYNRAVRVLAGMISWTVGMLSFGIFPAVGARFVIHFSGLPTEFDWLGVTWPMFPVTMAALVCLSLVFVVLGGHLTVLVTDFLQGAFTNVVGLVVILVLAVGVLHWGEVVDTLKITNDRRSLATGSAPMTGAGLDLALAPGDGQGQADHHRRAGVAMMLAGNLLESVDHRRPSVLATREMVARLVRSGGENTDEVAQVVDAVSGLLVQRCAATPYADAANAYRDTVWAGLSEGGHAPPGLTTGVGAAGGTAAYPRDTEALRYLASILLDDAAQALQSADPGAQAGADLLRSAAVSLPGNTYPQDTARQLAQAGDALLASDPATHDLAKALGDSGGTLQDRSTSLLDPVRTSGVSDFNLWYFLIAVVGMWWTVLSNIQGQSYIASARNGHEMRMGNVLAQWRWLALTLMFMLLVLATLVYTEHPDYTDTAGEIHAALDGLAERVGGSESVAEVQAGATVRNQQTVPIAMRAFLPAGVLGLFCALILAAIISTYDSFMHCWGSVFVQDVVIPFRKKAMTAREQIWWLRAAICMVAVIAFVFSWLYPQTQSILMFFALVNSIWLAPSGAVILGGLYWKRGTSAAAISTMIVGVAFGLLGVAAMQAWPMWFDRSFPVNGQWLFFYNIALSAAVYIGISLLGRRSESLDGLLHRADHLDDASQADHSQRTTLLMKCFGITREFTRGDRLTAYVIVGWFLALLVVFLIGTAAGLGLTLSEDTWARFWFVYLALLFVVTVVTTVWFTLGGFVDLVKLFRALGDQSRDFTDDGRVSHPPSGTADTARVEEESR